MLLTQVQQSGIQWSNMPALPPEELPIISVDRMTVWHSVVQHASTAPEELPILSVDRMTVWHSVVQHASTALRGAPHPQCG